MNKELNKLIDQNLALIFKAKNQSLWSNEFIENDDLSHSIVDEMKRLDLIETETDKDLCFLSAYGHTVIDDGGWYALMLDKEEPEYIADFGGRLLSELDTFMNSGTSKKEQYKKVKKKLFLFLFGAAILITFFSWWADDTLEEVSDFEIERREHVKMLMDEHGDKLDSLRGVKR